jgi:hypothetical protein
MAFITTVGAYRTISSKKLAKSSSSFAANDQFNDSEEIASD